MGRRARTAGPIPGHPQDHARPSYGGEFRGTIFRHSTVSAWHFVEVPESIAPRATHGWGRTPVRAIIDGTPWPTSVWRERSGRTILAIPRHLRAQKREGDTVVIHIAFDTL